MIGKNTKAKRAYFKPNDWKKVEERAAALNMKTGVFLRWISIYGEIRTFDFSKYYEIMFPLCGIKVYINQIIRVAEANGSPYLKELKAILSRQELLERRFKDYFNEMKYLDRRN